MTTKLYWVGAFFCGFPDLSLIRVGSVFIVILMLGVGSRQYLHTRLRSTNLYLEAKLLYEIGSLTQSVCHVWPCLF